MGDRSVIDADLRTLHIRCGTDIRDSLRQAGFGGDFLEYSDPVCDGPVPDLPELIDTRACFLAGAYGSFKGETEALLAAGLRESEDRVATAHHYERVVLWFEHDSYDQLILARCLACFGVGPLPARLELICIDRHPSVERFVGLGQLAPEVLATLWPARTSVTSAQLELGKTIWAALRQPDPRDLVAVVATGTPALPFASPALRRHLRELPGVRDGLSMTQRLSLQILSEGSATIGRMFATLMQGREPLPFLGDIMFLRIVEQMALTSPSVIKIDAGEQPFRRVASITETGRQVLDGTTDCLSLAPPERWLGGIRIVAGQPVWRFDEADGRVVGP
jgi:Domain of unknown function (DUF1835)